MKNVREWKPEIGEKVLVRDRGMMSWYYLTFAGFEGGRVLTPADEDPDVEIIDGKTHFIKWDEMREAYK